MNQPKRIPPGPGQESVWDYPRPPRLEPGGKHIQVIFHGEVIAETDRALRVLETSSPPVYYIPPEDVRREYLSTTQHHTLCEWKGQASYYSISVGGKTVANAAWYYTHPTQSYAALANFIAFYPAKMDACFVNGERVQPQEGDFYGGWITSEIVGPFKGGPGTLGW